MYVDTHQAVVFITEPPAWGWMEQIRGHSKGHRENTQLLRLLLR